MSAAKVTAEQVQGALAITRAVADAIKSLGEVPSGHLYAHLMGKLSLNEYTQVIGILKRAGLVTESSHLLKWVGPQAVDRA